MPTYSGSGKEPLRSNPSPKTSAPASGNASKGKPCGGTDNMRAYQATLVATQLKNPPSKTNTPPGVQSFTDSKV